MYFCQPVERNMTALIFDSLVAAWLHRETDVDLSAAAWSVSTYGHYLEKMHHWASSLDCSPDELEYCIFREMAIERKSQWGLGKHKGHPKSVCADG
jgi:hypothetical protein